MNHKEIRSLFSPFLLFLIVFVVLGIVTLFAYIEISKLKNEVNLLNLKVASSTYTLFKKTDELSNNISYLNNETSGLSKTLNNTEENINKVSNKVGGVEQAVGNISGTVNNLKKLSELDPELLNKYSKVYFLNENYKPERVVDIWNDYTYSSNRVEQTLIQVYPFLKAMLDGAKTDGMNIFVKSAYRSFSEQKSIKSSYTVLYGAGKANSFSADQGYSEHQLGTTVDLITTGFNGNLNTSFENTKEFEWLKNNAYKYGFILSYPKNNSYYIYEPWHWRFVGVKLATYLHNYSLNFYDLDQRMIDEYLINIFD